MSVSADYAYPPYSYFDKFGNPVGLDIDIFKALEEIMNIKFSFNLTEWDSALSNINSGRSDVVTGIIYSED
ncbi:MAG TPA: transporter substrate-binding domain-containing protein, partial [Bacteroidales bacterium]|nr:transporter substrate-binding domain-containing protein [Bacteroidales bacterium]